jgi:hypothetical protein
VPRVNNEENNKIFKELKETVANKILEKDNITGDINVIKTKYKIAKQGLKQKCKGLKKEALDDCKKEIINDANEFDLKMQEEIKEKQQYKQDLSEEINNIKKNLTKEKKSVEANSSQQSFLFNGCIIQPKKEKKEKQFINSALSEYSVKSQIPI